MSWTFWRLSVVVACVAISCGLAERQPRILGGTTTKMQTHPYMVAVARSGEFICGGTLLTPTCVLTAAHCVYDPSRRRDITVSAGENEMDKNSGDLYDDDDGKSSAKLKGIALPSGYRSGDLDMDVAVLQLERSLPGGSKLRPVEIDYETRLRQGDQLIVVGWGETGSWWHDLFFPLRLRAASVQVSDRTLCERSYKTFTGNEFCALGENGRDACSGDSGGPALRAGKQVGIVSSGVSCRRGNTNPGIYTRLGSASVAQFVRGAMTKYC